MYFGKNQYLMKKTLLLFMAGGFLFLSLSSSSNGPSNSSTGVQTAISGCGGGGCHGANSNNEANMSITLTEQATATPVTDGKYKPGVKYSVVISEINHPATKFGYILSVRDAANAQAGVLDNSLNNPDVQITNKSGFIVAEQPNSLNPQVGNVLGAVVTWTAPAAGTGDITFYGVINGVNGNGAADAGDTYTLKTTMLQENLSVSVEEISILSSVSIFPNPANNTINIRLEENNLYNYSIYGIDGSATSTGSISGNATIDIAELAAGSYFIKVSDENQSKTIPFVKQ